VNAPEALDRNCEDARCLHVLFPRGVRHVTDSRSPTIVVLLCGKDVEPCHITNRFVLARIVLYCVAVSGRSLLFFFLLRSNRTRAYVASLLRFLGHTQLETHTHTHTHSVELL